MAKILGLTETDFALLTEIIAERRGKPRNRIARDSDRSIDHQEIVGRQQYVAYVPSGGIAGRSDTIIYSALCTIFRKESADVEETGTLSEGGFTRRVFNLSHQRVLGGQFVGIWCDAYGTFYTTGCMECGGEEPGTGTGTEAPEFGTISAECCEGELLPPTLYLTIEGEIVTGSEDCCEFGLDTYEINHLIVGEEDWWQPDSNPFDPMGVVRLMCAEIEEGVFAWNLQQTQAFVGACGCLTGFSLFLEVEEICRPLTLIFGPVEFDIFAGCIGDPPPPCVSSYTFTITETPP